MSESLPYQTKLDQRPVEITHVEHGSKGAYTAKAQGLEGVAEMTYSRARPDLIIVDHTAVDDALRGQGMGTLLAQRVVEDSRANGQRIIPLCPFFKAQVERHPEWQDILQRD